MVAVYNKELLSWYLITLKLRETLDAGVSNLLGKATSPRLLEAQARSGQDEIIRDENENSEPRNETHDSEWVVSIKEKLDQGRQDDIRGLWTKLSIYKVPHYLKEGDDKAYVPQIVSLGPYHYNKRRLKNMEQHKWRSLHHILKRTNHDINLYLDKVKGLEEKARECYEGTISMSSNEFVEMMVLDGCFTLELFRGANGGFKNLGYPRNDPIFAMRGSMHSIQRDMIMLENQIPLFILDLLLGIQIGEPQQKGLVAKLAVRFFDPLMPTDEPLTENEQTKLGSSLRYKATFDPLSDQNGLHCLDVFRRGILKSGPVHQPSLLWNY